MLLGISWFAYDGYEWAKAFAGTALTLPGKPDLLAVSATIGAVAGVPIAILGLGLTKYMELRAKQPRVIEDRRNADQ